MSEFEEDLQHSESPMETRYNQLKTLLIHTKETLETSPKLKVFPDNSTKNRSVSQKQSILLEEDLLLGVNVGSALRVQSRIIKVSQQTVNQQQQPTQRLSSFYDTKKQSLINVSRDSSVSVESCNSINLKGILKKRGSQLSSNSNSNSSERLSDKKVQFKKEQIPSNLLQFK